ncbi:tetratricopeptide repeat protein [Thiogranum longum]|uniref:Tetratricopeptide repeat protein n=1 Tax=Thiogranum longum TaxID=1537524 RepID=A0A4R1HAH0_9GAMM|nr:tetratricopeptide repeat protein [Thiogranum longum]TCK17155.1 tetratricopeptide repeat protein [Thiogranum longum]
MIEGNAHRYTATLLFILITGTYVTLAIYYPVDYIRATYEDMYGEWTQTFLFATAFVLSLLLTTSPNRRQRPFFILLSIALFYVVMEEISWGQRLFGFETPDFFRRYNLQDETNIHNLLVGPVSTLTKQFIEYALASALTLYGLVYPLLIRARWQPALTLESSGLVAPPLYLWPFFVTAAFLELGQLNFNEAEIAEVLIAFALAAMSAHYWLLRHQPETLGNSIPSWKIALLMTGILGGAIALATVTTNSMLSDPGKAPRIQGRLLNGYEKFAHRYERYDQWQTALKLYLAVHRKEPARTSIMRKIANCYQQTGNRALFLRYNQMAIDTALKIYARNPGKVSTNLSLARSYRQRGDEARARQHLQRALRTARSRVEKNPGSAHAAYWLAKTYRDMRQYNQALSEYQRAVELDPGSTKYLKAYTYMRTRMGKAARTTVAP